MRASTRAVDTVAGGSAAACVCSSLCPQPASPAAMRQLIRIETVLFIVFKSVEYWISRYTPQMGEGGPFIRAG